MTEPLSDFPNHWLSLSDAAEQLGVHATTLRRWADNGDIPIMLTPGGHRRFAVQDLEAFAARQRGVSGSNQIAMIWGDRALQTTRQEIVSHEHKPWLNTFDSGERDANRQLGQRLLGLTMQFISAPPEETAELIHQAQDLGRQYGQLAYDSGLPLTEALEATLFFRDLLVETALQMPENAQIKPTANVRLLRKINQLMNTIQLQIAEAYDASRPDYLHRR
jgi:excisionase family DNA binding protein